MQHKHAVIPPRARCTSNLVQIFFILIHIVKLIFLHISSFFSSPFILKSIHIIYIDGKYGINYIYLYIMIYIDVLFIIVLFLTMIIVTIFPFM